MFKNKTLLITGGTGSFGNAILNNLLDTDIKKIIVFSRDEKKQEDMRLKLNNSKLKFYIGDVRDYQSVLSATKDVDYIFHASALKQVPSCEFFPIEAVKTNVLGSENVINASLENNVKKLVMLSTDKAVYPINSMGMTKALMEKLMIAKSRLLQRSDTVLCGTRYGNVMGSRGSVIPLFINQIKSKNDITITDPEMTRFLMSLEDSVDLVLHAFAKGKQGDIFVQKSPAATIHTIANALMNILGIKVKIKIIGTRHGEKIYESLVSREEMQKAFETKKYFTIPSDNRDLNYANYFTKGSKKITKYTDYTSHNTVRLNENELIKLLLSTKTISNLL